jgi:hypothetical protein
LHLSVFQEKLHKRSEDLFYNERIHCVEQQRERAEAGAILADQHRRQACKGTAMNPQYDVLEQSRQESQGKTHVALFGDLKTNMIIY